VVYGLDLLDFFRGRHSWRKLRLLLDRLPGTSVYREALLNDPEFAEYVAAQPESDGPPPRPALSEYDPTRAALDDIFDRLGEVVAATYNAAGGKAKPPPARLRPVTEVDRARERLASRRHDDLVSEVRAAQARWEQRREGV
jgi:hypothetical protein